MIKLAMQAPRPLLWWALTISLLLPLPTPAGEASGCVLTQLTAPTGGSLDPSCVPGSALSPQCVVRCGAGYTVLYNESQPHCRNNTANNATVFEPGNVTCVDTDSCAGTSCGEGAVCSDIAAPAVGFRCTCTADYVGAPTTDAPASCACRHGHYFEGRCARWALPAEMAPVYTVEGGGDASLPLRGSYVWTERNCSGKPVYQHGGRGGPVLFQPANVSDGWVVGLESEAGLAGGTEEAHGSELCQARGFLASSAHGAACPSAPDGAGCAGKWRQLVATGSDGEGGWVGVPSLTVTAVSCTAGDACCGVECGPHGACTAGLCACNGSYTGDRCAWAPAYVISGLLDETSWARSLLSGSREPSATTLCPNGYDASGACAAVPLPDGLAPAYSVRGGGAAHRPYRGVYVRSSSHRGGCNGKPTYVLASGVGLWQPRGAQHWVIGPASAVDACENSGFLASIGHGVGASCAIGPAHPGCTGRWRAWNATSGVWSDEPTLSVSSLGDSAHRGTYVRTVATCAGKPIYQRDGQGGPVLFRPTDSRRAHAGWMVGAASPGPIQAQAASVCDRGGGHISSAPEAVCIHSPDGTGCAGRWHAWDGRHWSETPTVVVAPLACPNASDLCCGVDCGTHGSCDGSSGDCVCRPPFFGPTCTLAPAYRLAGGTALAADFRGTYVHLSGLNCSGKPVYRLGGTTSEALANQIVLWQPAAAAAAAGGWMVGPGGDGAAVGNCGSTRGYLATSARGASCSSSPDGSGCVGAWREWDKDSAQWREPSAAAPVRVHALLCDIGDPCCGLDCGGHGVCHAGSCNCTHGYAGEFCDMAPGYTLSGGSQPALRGSYLRTAHRCHGKPVYQLGGEGGSILFRPAEHPGWMVGNSEHTRSCAAKGFITSTPDLASTAASAATPPGVDPVSCALAPDDPSCAGRWRESSGCLAARWCDATATAAAPAISFAALACAADASPCCGVDCGAHGSCSRVLDRLHGDGHATVDDTRVVLTRLAKCTCVDGFSGERCALAPAYTLSGASIVGLRGEYVRSATDVCSGRPVYRMSGETNAMVLFRPHGRSGWVVGQSSRVPSYGGDCENVGYINSEGVGGVCPAAPDGVGCVGTWQENTGPRDYDFSCAAGGACWQRATRLTVTAVLGQPHVDPNATGSAP
jgi:hypothetical protein